MALPGEVAVKVECDLASCATLVPVDVLQVGDHIGSIVAAVFTVASFVISLIVLSRQIYPKDPWKPFKKLWDTVVLAALVLLLVVLVLGVVAGYIGLSWEIVGEFGLEGGRRRFVAVLVAIVVAALIAGGVLAYEDFKSRNLRRRRAARAAKPVSRFGSAAARDGYGVSPEHSLAPRIGAKPVNPKKRKPAKRQG